MTTTHPHPHATLLQRILAGWYSLWLVTRYCLRLVVLMATVLVVIPCLVPLMAVTLVVFFQLQLLTGIAKPMLHLVATILHRVEHARHRHSRSRTGMLGGRSGTRGPPPAQQQITHP